MKYNKIMLIIFATVVLNFGMTNEVQAGLLSNIFGTGQGSKNTISYNKPLSQADKLLFNALHNNDFELAKQALQLGANVNAYKAGTGLPIDEVLNSTGNYEMIEWLIQNGADPEGWVDYTYSKKGITHYYIMRCAIKDIPFWVEHGVDPNKIKDHKGTKLINIILGRHKNREEAITVIQYLLDHGVDINYPAPDSDNSIGRWGKWTILHHATYKNDVVLVQYLLDHGANPNIKADGEIPLDIAMRMNNQECVKLLLKYKK